MEHLDAECGMTRGTLFLELSEETCGIGVFPFLWQTAKDAVAVAFAFPEGNNDVAVGGAGFLVRLERHLGTVVEYLQILHGVDANLRVGGCCIGCWSAFAHDEFSVVDADVLVLKDVLERQCALHRNRFGGGYA